MIQAKHSVIQSFVQKKGFRHKSKDASKKNMQKDTIWGKKKSKQTSNQMHLLRRTCRKVFLKYAKEKLLNAKVSGLKQPTEILLFIRRTEKE